VAIGTYSSKGQPELEKGGGKRDGDLGSEHEKRTLQSNSWSKLKPTRSMTTWEMVQSRQAM